MFNFDRIKLNGAGKLREIADSLIDLKTPKENKHFILNSSNISLEHYRKDQIDKVNKWANSRGDLYIYYFHALEGADIDTINQIFENAKNKKDRAYPRINKPVKPSRYLYVGSSKNIVSRFKEHLGDGNEKTYALHLYHWCSVLNFEIDFYCMKFDSKTDLAATQAFEDAMWTDLHPMFGRRGAR